jgi:predicted transcriptional regulator
MTTRNNPVTFYLTDEEKARLEEFADTAGKSLSELSRDAIREYTDKDRFQRIEEKLDRVLSTMDGGEHTHTGPSKQQSVPETAREIAKRIYANHDAPIKDNDVQIAIEDIGGGSKRIIDQYRQQLKKRGLLYEHPSDSSVWTDDKAEWAEWVENYVETVPTATVMDLLEPYGMELDEYDQLVETEITA